MACLHSTAPHQPRPDVIHLGDRYYLYTAANTGGQPHAQGWLNGGEVIGIYGNRQTVIEDGVSKRLTLRKGPNVLRAAIVNGGGATDFCAASLTLTTSPSKDFRDPAQAPRAATGQ